MKCKENHSGHAGAVLGFGIVYIFLFILDIATAIIMIVYGVGFLLGGALTSLTDVASSLSSVTNSDLKFGLSNSDFSKLDA
jgi:hypothetical protein